MCALLAEIRERSAAYFIQGAGRVSGHSSPTSTDEAAQGNPDLWSLAVTLAKNLPLLVLGPMLVGALTFLAVDWAPKRYVSTALVNPGMGEADVTDPSLAAWRSSMLKTVPALMGSPEVQQAMAPSGTQVATNQVRTRVNAADGTISLSVTASSPEQAQQLAQSLLEATIAASRPKSEERTRLESDHKRLTDQILLLEATSRQLREALARASTPQETGALAVAIPSVMEHTVTLEKRLALSAARLRGLTNAAIVTPPTLPTEATGPRRGLWSIVSAIGTLCLLISAVLLRQVWLDWRRAPHPAGWSQGQPQDKAPVSHRH